MTFPGFQCLVYNSVVATDWAAERRRVKLSHRRQTPVPDEHGDQQSGKGIKSRQKLKNGFCHYSFSPTVVTGGKHTYSPLFILEPLLSAWVNIT